MTGEAEPLKEDKLPGHFLFGNGSSWQSGKAAGVYCWQVSAEPGKQRLWGNKRMEFSLIYDLLPFDFFWGGGWIPDLKMWCRT